MKAVAAYYNKNGESNVMNNYAEDVVALELCRFLAHCVAAFVVVGMLFIGLIGSWIVALEVGVVPLLAITACDLIARRKENPAQTVDA